MKIDDLKNITWLIENDGEISIGRIGSISCAAVATDGNSMLASVVKRSNESISQMLFRLDEAIDKAWNEDVYLDEINE